MPRHIMSMASHAYKGMTWWHGFPALGTCMEGYGTWCWRSLVPHEDLRFSRCTELHIAGGDSALGMVWHPLPAGPSLAWPLQPHWCLRCLGLGCLKQLLWQLAVCGRSSVEPCYPILAVLTCSYCSSIRSPEAVPELPPPLLSLARLMARGPPSFCLSTIHGDYDYFGLMHHIPNNYINYFTSCDPHHDIYTFCYWQIFWHSIWHSIRHLFWHFIWHIFWHSIWHIFWHSIWHLIWHSLWHTFWHSIWHIF